MQKRLLFLPLIWGAYGIGEVAILTYLFGPIVYGFNGFFYPQNDKPIGGSYLPALAFNVVALFGMVGFSLWALGVWSVDLSNPKLKRDIAALSVLFGSLFLVFYSALFLFPLTVALIYFLATNIE